MVASYEYDACGNHRVYDGDDRIDTEENSIGNLNPFRYRGYYYDTDLQLYYLQTRYYDPETGRFINLDRIEYLDPETINGLNLYAYCGNNPVMNTDPDGTLFLGFLIASIIIGAIVGGAVNAYNAYEEGADALGIVGAFLGGAITGGAMGAVMAIGGAAGVASLGISLTGFGLSTIAAVFPLESA